MARLCSLRRSGFTLTEVIVVLILVVVGIGLLLPFVQRTHGSSAAMGTSNNIKQMVISHHFFEATHKFLPPLDWNAVTTGPMHPGPDGKPARTQSGFHENFFSAILPFAELDPIYASLAHTGFTPGSFRNGQPNEPGTVYNLTVDVNQGSPILIKMFQNPLDPTKLPSGMNGNTAVTGFAINGSALPMVNGAEGKKVSLEMDFPDGTSNTIFIAEKYSGANGKSQATPWTRLSCKTIDRGHGWFSTEVDGAAFGGGATLEFAPDPSASNWANGIQSGRRSGILLGMFDGSVRTLTPATVDAYQALMVPTGQIITILDALIEPNDGLINIPDW